VRTHSDPTVLASPFGRRLASLSGRITFTVKATFASLCYGPSTHLQLLPTCPRGHAVSFGFTGQVLLRKGLPPLRICAPRRRTTAELPLRLLASPHSQQKADWLGYGASAPPAGSTTLPAEGGLESPRSASAPLAGSATLLAEGGLVGLRSFRSACWQYYAPSRNGMPSRS
jgi:hypothetical protein